MLFVTNNILVLTYQFPQVTYRYYDTFNMKHENLSMFTKNEYEGDFHWRDINVNKDLTILESQMLVRHVHGYTTIPQL